MKILFSHQNYPAQFGAFGAWLATRGWDVVFVTAASDATAPAGCRMVHMVPHRAVTPSIHRYAAPLERAAINGQAFANACVSLRNGGFTPDIVVGHSGWGSGSFARAVWPDCKFVAYAEWYYQYPPSDGTSDTTERSEEDLRAFALCRNAPTLLDLAQADTVWVPTAFQAAQFPEKFRPLLTVHHDGVDTDTLCPSPDGLAALAGVTVPADAEIVTYATRGMEPHRGFPEFMTALAHLQKSRPNLHALIGGADRVCYGKVLDPADSWKRRMLARLDLDLSRVHFTGLLSRTAFTGLMQASHVHVYLSVPFVLSWSLIEAMSIGCPLVTSDTAPLREVLVDGVSATMVDHTDTAALADGIADLLDNRAVARFMGDAARDHAVAHFSQSSLWPEKEAALRRLLPDQPAAAVA